MPDLLARATNALYECVGAQSWRNAGIMQLQQARANPDYGSFAYNSYIVLETSPMIPRSRSVYLPLFFLMGICHSASANQTNCDQIVSETVIEMKAGASRWWTEDTARMAAMAAATACFKTKAFDVKKASPQDTKSVSSNEFMGLKVRPLTGPPSRKPYQRTDRD